MIIQTIGLDRSGSVWTDEASNVSRLDPSGAVQSDAEHPSRDGKVVGSNPTSGSKTADQKAFLASLTAQRQQAIIPLDRIIAPQVPILGVLPSGTPVAFEAAYGWGWLVDLLESTCSCSHATTARSIAFMARCVAATVASSLLETRASVRPVASNGAIR
jgi:hypothetical protein